MYQRRVTPTSTYMSASPFDPSTEQLPAQQQYLPPRLSIQTSNRSSSVGERSETGNNGDVTLDLDVPCDLN